MIDASSTYWVRQRLTFAGVDTPPLPVFEMESLLTVLLGMLGLGGLRSWEKTKQVAREK